MRCLSVHVYSTVAEKKRVKRNALMCSARMGITLQSRRVLQCTVAERGTVTWLQRKLEESGVKLLRTSEPLSPREKKETRNGLLMLTLERVYEWAGQDLELLRPFLVLQFVEHLPLTCRPPRRQLLRPT
jgi:hypothetical protein